MDKKYIVPETDVVVINVSYPILGDGDAAGSPGADGGDGWANKNQFDDSEDFADEISGKSGLWDN